MKPSCGRWKTAKRPVRKKGLRSARIAEIYGHGMAEMLKLQPAISSRSRTMGDKLAERLSLEAPREV